MFRKTLFAALISSSLTSMAESRELDVTDMPEEFKSYFFNSPVPARVLLNDEFVFDGTLILSENGNIRLKSILSSAENTIISTEEISQWEKHLMEGISLGKCTGNCPEGFIAAEYILERSELKIYTRQYEQNRIRNNYIQLPDELPPGLIINNDVTASGNSSYFDNWRLTSSVLSSLFGWTQKLMLQSAYSHSSTGYRNNEISEAWTQKELEGSYLRAGLFSPDAESGNVQMPGYASSRIAGAMWGTSDTLLNPGDSVSIYPVYVTGRNQSVADVFINDRLVYTQQLQAGIQALDTRRLPGGVYDITIRITENGSVMDVQTAQVYKPARWENADKRWRASIWGGQAQQEGLTSGEQSSKAWGVRADFLLHPRSTAGISLERNAQDQLWSLKNETQVTNKTTLYSRYNLWQDGRRDSDIRVFRTLETGSISAGWRHGVTTRQNSLYRISSSRTSDIYNISLTWQLPQQFSLTAGSQYASDGYRNGWSSDIAIRKTLSLWRRSTELRLSAYQRPAWNTGRKDTGAEIGISIPLFSDSRVHSASAEVGAKNNVGYANMNYNWRPEEPSGLSYLGATTSLSKNSTTAGVNGGVQGPYASGDFYLQTTRGAGGLYSGVNLSNTLAIGGGNVAVSGDMRDASAVVIVDVESSQKKSGLTVVSTAGEVSLKPGRNLVSADVWQRRNMQFDGNNAENMYVNPAGYSYQMNRGSVGFVSIKAVRKKTIIALLSLSDGSPILNRETESDIAQAYVNSDGVVTIDVSDRARHIIVTDTATDPAMLCELPDMQQEKRDTIFIEKLSCEIK
nr:hypothetical protein 1137p_00103 [Serratia proteamaculans]